jgi:2-C-methyl-D-erythritol 2,4-cyclodiphosphate synthase
VETGPETKNTMENTLPFRIGHGYDLHRLQTGGKLLLAGVEVSNQISPIAHSDGDVILHALVDAMLGAMGWGDIGEHFPDTDATWRGAASRVFVETIYTRVREAGYKIANIDVTLLAEQPKIKPFKPAMAASLRSMLGGENTLVNVKAGTNEGCDAIGRGEAIAAHAVVLLVQS